MPSWVQDPVTHELIPKEEYYDKRETDAAYIHGDIKNFVSPIDNSVITDRAQLRRHMKEHGVTNSADYSHEFMMKKSIERNNIMVGNNPQAKSERIELLNQALRKEGI